MKNRSHFTAPFHINTQLLDGIASKVLKDFEAKQKERGVASNSNNGSSGNGSSSQLLAKNNPMSSQKQLGERPWDRAGIGAEALSNAQKQTQLSQSCFRSEDDLPAAMTASSSVGAGAKELDVLKKVVLGTKGRPEKEMREEELRAMKDKREEKKQALDDENSKIKNVIVASNNTTAGAGGAGANQSQAANSNNNNSVAARKGTMSLLEQELAKKKKKKGATAPAAPVRERVVEMAEGIEDYEEDDRLAKKNRPE